MWDTEEPVATIWLSPRRLLIVAACVREGRAYVHLRAGRPDGRGGFVPGRQELVLPVLEAPTVSAALHRAELCARALLGQSEPDPGPVAAAHAAAAEAARQRG